jgi:hypothetical protein
MGEVGYSTMAGVGGIRAGYTMGITWIYFFKKKT